MRKSIILLCVFLWWSAGHLTAQRVHSSQFYSIPLLLNPALTGNSNYNLRAGANYRNQWNSVTVPFLSQAVHADGKLGAKFLGASWLGVGLMLFNDKAGQGSLRTTQATFSTSYNKNLNAANTLFFHAGLGVTMVNKSVDYNKLVFDDQWDGKLFDPNYVSGEPLGKQSLFYPDLSAGVSFTMLVGTTRFFLGTSLRNINQPNESFYKITNNLQRRLAVHGGMEKRINSYLYVKPQFMYTVDKNGKETIMGLNCITPFGRSETSLYYGLWYRFSKDIIPAFGFERKRLKLMITYDINVSGLQVASSQRGGFELSLTYYLNFSGDGPYLFKCRRRKAAGLNRGAMPCPKFSR